MPDNEVITSEYLNGLICKYRSDPDKRMIAAYWLLSHDDLMKIRKVKNGAGCYIWQITDGMGNSTILGLPYILDESVKNMMVTDLKRCE